MALVEKERNPWPQTETSRPPKLVLELSYLVLRRNMLRPSLIPGTISEAACVTVIPVLGL